MVHVFPRGSMCSLRRALLLWLVPLFILVGLASAAFAYWSYGRMVDTFMDDQMEQLAQSISSNEGYMPQMVLTLERAHQWGTYVTQVFGGDRALQVTTLPELRAGLQPEQGFHDLQQDGSGWRVFTTAASPTGHRVQVLQSSQFRSRLAVERAGAAIVPILLLLPLAMLVLWSVVAAVSRAVQDIGRQAAQQDEHNLSQLTLERVPAEIKPLVTSFNSLLARLRDAFAAQHRFVQDAAHELRTPITAVALQLENVRRDLPAGACRQSFAQLESGVQRAQRLVDQLLKMSRQEAATPDPAATVDLEAQLRESINTLIGLADQRNIDLGLVAGAGAPPAALRCACGDLRSVLDNLIENALRYTPEGGVVDVRVLNEGGKPAVEVVDNGPGIPEDMLPRVFDRFFRVPGNGARGSGLGLAIAQSAAQRCGLRIALRNREDGSGLVARVEPA
ncbi:sensor histidine kinase [Caenimonas terrae]|uniref:histidine kinase n=1 Tax=Caenimonas terrae TaxID=696074 RepID=A0ABW0NB82_9BURK